MGVSPLTGSTESRGPGVGQQEGQTFEEIGCTLSALDLWVGEISTTDGHVDQAAETESRSMGSDASVVASIMMCAVSPPKYQRVYI